MSPRKRRGTYRPPRPRREVVTAVVATAAVIVFTGIMVFVLGPHTSTPATSTTTTVPASSGLTTPTSAAASTPATSTPAATGSTATTTPGG